MKFTLQNSHGWPERDFMRKINYIEHRDRHSPGVSYIRRAKPGGSFYPRYHAHVRALGTQVEIDLHYDWRRPMHVKQARSSDQSGDVVEREVARIRSVAARLAAEEASPAPDTAGEKKGFWEKLFGKSKVKSQK